MAGPEDREAGGGDGFVLKLKNRLDELDELHRFFERLGQRAAWPERLGMHLTLACEELVTNTISYGFPQGGTIRFN